MVELRLRWFTRFELELLLQTAGWQVDELYGNYDLEPYGPDERSPAHRRALRSRPAARGSIALA